MSHVSDEPSDQARSDAEGPDRRQLAFTLLAAVALVLAAFLAPTVAAPGGGGGGNGGDLGGGSVQDGSGGGGGGTDVPVSIFGELLRWLGGIRGGGTIDDTGHTCSITPDEEPFPGSTVTVLVTYDGEPLADAPVWFNDRRVGRTDADGTVSGEVPYERELVIRVGVSDRPDCRTRTRRIGASYGAYGESTAGGAAAELSKLSAAGAIDSLSPVGVAAAQESSSDPTATYPVDANATVQVVGRPLPGETVSVVAKLDDQPFPNASLAVNGESVGRTDADGRARLTVPDDGTEKLRVRVQRGEFSATTSVDVLLLQVRLVPVGLAVVPGAEANVEATFGGDRLEGATVTVAGADRGTTGQDGRVRVDLPADPTASVVVTAHDQTATTSVAAAYWPAVAVLAVVLAGLCVLAYRRWGTGGAVGVLGIVASVLTVLVTDAFYGPTGRYVVLGTLATATALFAAYRWRRNLVAGAETTTGLLRRLLDRLRTVLAVLRHLPVVVVSLLGYLRERLLAATLVAATMLGVLVDWLRSLPRSGRALVALLVARLRTVVMQAGRELQNVSPVGVALVGGALVLTVAAYRLGGRAGLLVTVSGLVLAGLVWLWRRRRPDVSADEDAEGTDAETFFTPPVADLGATTLRELWRAFARAVVPDRWRTQTPREVAQTAVEQGYPRAPVEALTALFREVEYGRRSLSSAVRERATTAYTAIREHDLEEEQ